MNLSSVILSNALGAFVLGGMPPRRRAQIGRRTLKAQQIRRRRLAADVDDQTEVPDSSRQPGSSNASSGRPVA